MCLTETSVTLPAIKFPSIDSADSFCRLSDVLFPAQSYLAYVLVSVSSCISDVAPTRYHLLKAKFLTGTLGLM